MKSMHSLQRLAVVVLCACGVVFLAHCDNKGTDSHKLGPATEERDAFADTGFPLRIGGSTVVITPNVRRSDLVEELKRTIDQEPSLDTAERLQFDFIASPEAGPLTLMVDWTADGAISEFVLDAYIEENNPVARDLKEWLVANHGQPEPDAGLLFWSHGGWEFRFTDGGDGEDSVYGFRITRIGDGEPSRE